MCVQLVFALNSPILLMHTAALEADSMTDKINVTVAEKDRRITIGVGYAGYVREIGIDLTDAKSVVDGVVTAANLGDQLTQGRIAELAKRVEALEKFSKEDLQYLARLVRMHPREFRPDGKPTSDDALADKLDALVKP